jgi:hypothetical protein
MQPVSHSEFETRALGVVYLPGTEGCRAMVPGVPPTFRFARIPSQT